MKNENDVAVKLSLTVHSHILQLCRTGFIAPDDANMMLKILPFKKTGKSSVAQVRGRLQSSFYELIRFLTDPRPFANPCWSWARRNGREGWAETRCLREQTPPLVGLPDLPIPEIPATSPKSSRQPLRSKPYGHRRAHAAPKLGTRRDSVQQTRSLRHRSAEPICTDSQVDQTSPADTARVDASSYYDHSPYHFVPKHGCSDDDASVAYSEAEPETAYDPPESRSRQSRSQGISDRRFKRVLEEDIEQHEGDNPTRTRTKRVKFSEDAKAAAVEGLLQIKVRGASKRQSA